MAVSRNGVALVDIFGWLVFKLNRDPLQLLQDPDRLTEDQKTAFVGNIGCFLDGMLPVVESYRKTLSLADTVADHLGLFKQAAIPLTDPDLAKRVAELLVQQQKHPTECSTFIDAIQGQQNETLQSAVKAIIPDPYQFFLGQGALDAIDNSMPRLCMPKRVPGALVDQVTTGIRKLFSIYFDSYAQDTLYARSYLSQWVDQVCDLLEAARPGQLIEFSDIPKIPFRVTKDQAKAYDAGRHIN